MSFRKFDTATWDDPWFETLTIEQRYLFIYLWTNSRCNQAGMYEISVAKITKDTNLPPTQVESLMVSLQSHVGYYPDKNIVFVKNFLKHQCQNHSFAESALKIVSEKYPEFLQTFVNTNLTVLQKFGVAIPPTPHQPPTVVTPTPHHVLQNRTEAEQRSKDFCAKPKEFGSTPEESLKILQIENIFDSSSEGIPPSEETPSPAKKPPSEEIPVLVFPCNGKPKVWNLYPSKIAEWKESFPGVDVLAECRRALQWVKDNPTRGKTAKGMARFLGGWLSRENDCPKTRSPSMGSGVDPPERSPDENRGKRIQHYLGLVKRKREEGLGESEIKNVLRRCALESDEIEEVIGRLNGKVLQI